MRRLLKLLVAPAFVCGAAAIAGCSGTGSKVLQDFGLQDRPEGYVSGAERVLTKLPDVAKPELARLNAAARNGEVLYEKFDSLTGAYYKKVKVYEDFRPLDANYAGRTSTREDVSYVGYIEYVFQYYESPRRPSRIEASAELADIPTGERGGETYRYDFSSGGVWDGAKGEHVRQR